MKKTVIFFALSLLLSAPAMAAYTAYPDLTSSTANGGLTTGSLIGYTVYALDGATVIQTRTTTGIVESPVGSGYYTVTSGLSVPTGTTYIVRWDRSDTSTFLGAAKTQINSLGTDTLAQATTNGTSLTAVQSKTALIATNAADSPATNTAQANAASSATGIASANLILAKFLFDTSNFVKAATQTLPTTPPTGYGGSGGGGGDPWTTLLPGPYGPGSAGFIVGNSLGVKATAVDTSPTLAQTQAMLAAQSTQTVTIVTGRKGQTVPLVVNFSGVIYTIPLNTPTVVPQSIYEILVNGGYAP
jgi:hypothetical protein